MFYFVIEEGTERPLFNDRVWSIATSTTVKLMLRLGRKLRFGARLVGFWTCGLRRAWSSKASAKALELQITEYRISVERLALKR